MGAYPFDYDYPAPVPDLHNQTIRIPFDIEDNPVVRQKIGGSITPFYVLRCLPCFPFNFIAPRVQLPADIGVMLLEVFEQGQVQYAHLEGGFIPDMLSAMIFPNMGIVNNSSKHPH